jgi:ion channel POLLUX/CASTOR
MLPMMKELYTRSRDRAAARLDRFLRARGILQAAVVLSVLVGVVAAFAAAIAMSGGAAEGSSAGDAAWWALGRFSDGGTMYGDHGARLRVLGALATWIGVFLVQFMTGFVTAKLTARLDRISSGHSPAVEHDHVLVLGFDSKTPLIARELARSHQPVVLVVLADEDVRRMDAMLAAARRIPHNRLRIETRAGDPRDELSLLRVGADRAGAIVVLAPDGLDDAQAMRWTFSTLLAVRRVAGSDFRGHVVVESRHLESQYLFSAAAEAPASMPDLKPLRLIQIAGDDMVARVLAQSIRQLGVYFVLRELLSFRGCELYFEPVPDQLAGKSFDEVHAKVHGAMVVGLRARGAVPQLNPRGDVRLERGDHLIVLEEDRDTFLVDGALELPEPRLGADEIVHKDPLSVVVLGENRALPEFLAELDGVLSPGSEVTVFARTGAAEAELVVPTRNIRITREGRDPVQVARELGPALLGADVVVVLGVSAACDVDADAAALETLMTLRHAERLRGVRVPRLLTELSDFATASHVMATSDDFVVSSEILALLIGQLAITPDLEPVLHDDLLNPGCNDVFLRPRQVYVGEGEATFADVMAGARRRREVAIGLFLSDRTLVSPDLRALLTGRAEDDEITPARLNPPRSDRVPLDARVVVIAREQELAPACRDQVDAGRPK